MRPLKQESSSFRTGSVKSLSVAVGISSAVGLKGSGSNDVLVITLDNQPTMAELEQFAVLCKRLNLGIEIIAINAKSVQSLGDQTYFASRLGHKGKVIADGCEIDRAVWCETKLGLVCTTQFACGSIAYRLDRYKKVEFVPCEKT